MSPDFPVSSDAQGAESDHLVKLWTALGLGYYCEGMFSVTLAPVFAD